VIADPYYRDSCGAALVTCSAVALEAARQRHPSAVREDQLDPAKLAALAGADIQHAPTVFFEPVNGEVRARVVDGNHRLRTLLNRGGATVEIATWGWRGVRAAIAAGVVVSAVKFRVPFVKGLKV
jgi:hypothetical protein